MSVDPLAEKYYPMGGYGYCAGRPITLIDSEGSDWYSTTNKNGETEYHYTEEYHNQTELNRAGIKGQYIGLTFKTDDNYYSLFGETVYYQTPEGKNTLEGLLYEKIDNLLIKNAEVGSRQSTSLWDTEAIPEAKEDFYLGLKSGMTFNFSYNGQSGGQHFTSNKNGTIYRAVDKKNMILSILRFPQNEERRYGGYNIGYDEPQWNGCFLVLGSNKYETIQIQYDKYNAQLFRKAYDRLFKRF